MSKIDEKAAELEAMLGEIELRTMEYTLADAIREGSSVTEQAYNWGDGYNNACALTAAVISAKARGFIK